MLEGRFEMARLEVLKFNGKRQASVQYDSSRTRQAAKKAGINMPKIQPGLPEVEQEATDIS